MDSNPHATPQDTLAALRARYTGELAVAFPEDWQAGMKVVLVGDNWIEDYQGREAIIHDIIKEPGSLYRKLVIQFESGKTEKYDELGEIFPLHPARESVPRDARLKLALLEWVELRLLTGEQLSHYDRLLKTTVQEYWAIACNAKTGHTAALSLLRLLVKSAGEAVAW